MMEGLATVSSAAVVDEEALEEIEIALIRADVGVDTSMQVVEAMRERLQQADSAGLEDVFALLEAELQTLVESDREAFDPAAPLAHKPHVILVVGVNGVGKTTTIGKLAHRYGVCGKRVMVAACDTFRAAALDQLEVWSERAGADIVRSQSGADPAAVAFDAVSAATSRDADVLIVDTAGRLHTKVNLMEELKKVRRSLGKQGGGAPHETLLVLDATTGQNALSQARQFHEATEVTGLVLTKLDGTAKGGIALALCQELEVPIKLVGFGEEIDDLQAFDGGAFVRALMDR